MEVIGFELVWLRSVFFEEVLSNEESANVVTSRDEFFGGRIGEGEDYLHWVFAIYYS